LTFATFTPFRPAVNRPKMVLVPKYWENFFESLYSPESWLKVVILLAFLPVWGPTVKAMLREFLDSLNEEKSRKLAPGEDPFFNVPRSEHRRALVRQKELTPRARGAASPEPAKRVATRRTGFAPIRR
jgi:hypothetical protein